MAAQGQDLEVLKHELQRDRKLDPAWGEFVVDEEFFAKTGLGNQPAPDPGTWLVSQRDILRNMVAAHEAGDDTAFAAALADIPDGWRLVTPAWNAIKNFAFLEYHSSTPTTTDFSSAWENKTARYFRDFLAHGDIQAEIIT